jgi:hypothetical protein
MQQQQQPNYNSGHPVDRVGSGNYDSRSVKSDKRRSGFFGFGKKDKEKDSKEKDVCGLSLSQLLGVIGFYQSERGVVRA